jgi:flagellar basal body-associated protein FliL
MMEIIQLITILLSVIAAVLAWAAKLWWGKEHIEAKNETIRSKEAQIDLLKEQIQTYKELTPMKIREYFTSVKMQLEEYNDGLKTQLEKANSEIHDREKRITELTSHGDRQGEEIQTLLNEKREIELQAGELKARVIELEKRQTEVYKNIFITYPWEASYIHETEHLARQLRNRWVHTEFDKYLMTNMDKTYNTLVNSLSTWLTWELTKEGKDKKKNDNDKDK